MGFSASIGKWAGDTITRTENVGKQAAIALFRGVILDTPVDTGRLRANWQVITDSPAFSQLDLDDKNGAQTIVKMTTVVFAQGHDFTVYMANNLPYTPVTRFVVGTTYSASTSGAIAEVQWYPAVYAHIVINPVIVDNAWVGKPNDPIKSTGDNRIPPDMTRVFDAYWQGKTILFCGMSITANGNADYVTGSSGVRNGYVYQVGKMLNATIINNAVPGSKMTFTATDPKSFSATIDQLIAAGLITSNQSSVAYSFENLLLGKTADLRVLDFGINDRSAAIGTITDAENTTLYGAYNYVLTRLFAENSLYQVALMTPHSLYAGSNSNNNTSAIRQAIIDIGKKYCVPVLDWTESLQLSLAYTTYWLDDGLHPAQTWHTMAARRLYRFISQL